MLSDYLGEDLKEFVDRFIVSFLAWDIVVYFHKNRDARFSAEEIASCLGRRPDDVLRESEALCAKGFLIEEDGRYGFCGDPILSDRLSDFYEALSDREKRLRILSAVLQKR